MERSKKKTLIIISVGILIIGAVLYQFIYRPNHPSLQSKSKQYSKNPDLLATQDVMSKYDKAIVAEANKKPLLQILPYTDGYIYISTSQSSYHLLVQYTTSLSDANKQFNDLLTKHKDSGKYYQVDFRKVPKLIQYD